MESITLVEKFVGTVNECNRNLSTVIHHDQMSYHLSTAATIRVARLQSDPFATPAKPVPSR